MNRYCKYFLLLLCAGVSISLVSSAALYAQDTHEQTPSPLATQIAPHSDMTEDSRTSSAHDTELAAPSAEPAAITTLSEVPPVEIQEHSAVPLESPPPTSSPSYKGPPRPLTALEVLEMQSELLETLYLSKKTIEARAELLTVYERRIGPTCMPSMTATLLYYGNPTQGDPCDLLIKKIVALDPENPLAICAQEGIDAIRCRTATSVLGIGVYSLDAPYEGASNLEAKIRESRNAPLVEQLTSKLNSLTFKKPDRLDPKREQTIRTLYSQILALTCVAHRIKLEPSNESPLSTATAQKNAPKRNALLSDDELAFIEKLGTRGDNKAGLPPTKETTSGGPYFYRTRLIPSQCDKFVSRALTDYPRFAPAICQKYGYFTPQCIDAKRVEKREVELKKKSPSTSAPISAQEAGDIGRF